MALEKATIINTNSNEQIPGKIKVENLTLFKICKSSLNLKTVEF